MIVASTRITGSDARWIALDAPAQHEADCESRGAKVAIVAAIVVSDHSVVPLLLPSTFAASGRSCCAAASGKPGRLKAADW
eukprot:5903676-Prymnesium_polylepis.2